VIAAQQPNIDVSYDDMMRCRNARHKQARILDQADDLKIKYDNTTVYTVLCDTIAEQLNNVKNYIVKNVMIFSNNLINITRKCMVGVMNMYGGEGPTFYMRVLRLIRNRPDIMDDTVNENTVDIMSDAVGYEVQINYNMTVVSYLHDVVHSCWRKIEFMHRNGHIYRELFDDINHLLDLKNNINYRIYHLLPFKCVKKFFIKLLCIIGNMNSYGGEGPFFSFSIGTIFGLTAGYVLAKLYSITFIYKQIMRVMHASLSIYNNVFKTGDYLGFLNQLNNINIIKHDANEILENDTIVEVVEFIEYINNQEGGIYQ